jgi:hypothetical protein
MNIAAIMPCRGRAEQTVANVKRLLATAGDVEWSLICVVDGDDDAMLAIGEMIERSPDLTGRLFYRFLRPSHGQRWGYWRSLELATTESQATHFVNLANDLLPGMHWLKRAADAYQATFGSDDGMIGFNGDSHEVDHSCHFLISRGLLDRYGGWPTWYDHNFGDTELCQRSIADGCYAKAPWALLYHDHPYWGGQDDAVYAEGRANVERDQALYQQRRAQGWPTQPRTR